MYEISIEAFKILLFLCTVTMIIAIWIGFLYFMVGLIMNLGHYYRKLWNKGSSWLSQKFKKKSEADIIEEYLDKIKKKPVVFPSRLRKMIRDEAEKVAEELFEVQEHATYKPNEIGRGEKPDTPRPTEVERKEPKYFIAVEFYPNCRGHEEGYFQGILSFSSFDEVLDYALNRIDDIAIVDILDSNGGEVGKFVYEIGKGGHNCVSITFMSSVIHLNSVKTVDNGHGKLVWSRL